MLRRFILRHTVQPAPVVAAALVAVSFAACVSNDGPTNPAAAVDAALPDLDGGTVGDAAGDATGTVDAGPVLTPCPAVSGAGTEHSKDITADETWTAAASPHKVTYHVRITATVTIEPCATVLLSEGMSLSLGNTGIKGTLIARGQKGKDSAGATVRRLVTFAAADTSKAWGGITVDTLGMLDLETALLSDGANASSDQNGGGVVLAYGVSPSGGAAPPLTKNVRAVDVTVTKARGMAFNFQRTSGFTDDSTDVTVTGSGRVDRPSPIRLEPGAYGTLPKVSLSGNIRDEVLLVAQNTSMLSDTIKARGVPYRLEGRLRVVPYADGAPSTLTVEPGVTLRMDDTPNDSGIQLGTTPQRQGVIVANGTAAAPILFTSAKATPAAGDWRNIYFSYSPSTGNSIRYATLEYAGAPSGAQGFGCGPAENDATVLMLAGRPDDAFIQNTTIKNAGGDTGILCGWVSDTAGPDFLATNTFVSAPACKVSRWRNATGTACPGSTAGSPVCF